MTPKKLSEIGSTLYWGNWTDSRSFITEACAERERLKTEAPEVGHTTITHSYSPAERRELVREAIVRWTENLYGDRNITIPSIDDWLKEQGI